MNSSARQSPERSGTDEASAERGKLAELRSLLLAPERSQLVNLQTRLSDPKLRAEDIGTALPDAIRFGLSRNDQLGVALGPLVEDTIRLSVKKDPVPLADALFPVMGPAIRRAIAAALSSMIQSLNQTLDHSLSLRGLKWRIEALRTGKSFAEVILLHTLVYRVEQVLLIHKESGLLLQQVTAPAVDVRDVDLVSGMLTAIQDFAHDSFSLKRGEGLETMEVGDLTIWIEPGPLAVLIGVIRGEAPNDLRPVFQDAVERIHHQHRQLLDAFHGDAAAFEICRPQLEPCLQVQYGSSSPKKFPVLLMVMAGLILLAALYWAFVNFRSNQRWEALLSRLRSESGVVLVSAEKREGKYFITGLRDPLAADPDLIVNEAALDPARIVSRWEPYQSTAMPFVLARAKSLLDPPETVRFSFENGVLRASGLAHSEWVGMSKRLVRFIPGVTQFLDDQVIDSHKVESIRKSIELASILFATGGATPLSSQTQVLATLSSQIRSLAETVQPADASIQIDIVGHTDSTGSEDINRRLSKQRAEAVLQALVARGVSRTMLVARAARAGEPPTSEVASMNRDGNRRVDFRASLSLPPARSER